MRRKREDWILDGLSNVAVLACDDPAEQLARVAAGHGALTVSSFDCAQQAPIYAEIAGHHARSAWRFALAALDLHDLYDVMDGARLIFESTKARAGAMDGGDAKC